METHAACSPRCLFSPLLVVFGEMLPKALPALGGYNVSFFVEVASRRAKCEKIKKKAVYYKVLFNITCE